MAEGSTTALAEALGEALPERPFTLEFWDGNRIDATAPGGPTISFRSPEAIRQALRAPGELGLGRAYVTGNLDVDDLDAALGLFGNFQAPPMGPARKAKIGIAALRAAGLKRPPPPPAAELQPRGNRHSKNWDSESVRHHYDVSNEFFALFLDESMTYSCALFADGAETLEDAQFAKLDLVCRKVGLEPGTRILDIGSGWGSMGIHAAKEFGAKVTGITLSPPQAELANQRAAEAGVGELCEFRVQDYRDLGDERFAAISSIGMIEHVGGENIDEYAACIEKALEPGGRVLNHGITWTEPEVHIGADFSERYVFPGGEIPPLSRVLLAFERAGLEPLHVENMHRDYIETLRHWAERLDQNLPEAERLAGAERLRVWRLYLRAARNGFEVGLTSLFQTMLSRPIVERAG
ncbi:MAG: cyclopropane-fatty-acyl-phospholipid synthase, partial [Gaiellales bacterium]|nr:cyclopropane-fatty-acyl-phospholipid synthase [Gaiellales bacterium]